jgi:general L-amino acid transport system permease protein
MKGRPLKTRLTEVAIYLLVAAGIAFAVLNAIENLRQRGIASGFGFLGHRAGFDVGFKLLSFTSDDSYGRAFLVGLLNTLAVALVAVVCATFIGLALAVGQLSHSPALRGLARGVVELVRNCPLLLQIFAWYFLLLAPLPPARQSLTLGLGVLLNNRGLYLPSAALQGVLPFCLLAAVALLAAVLLRRRRRRATLGAVPAALRWRSDWPWLAAAALVLVPGFLLAQWEVPVLQGFNLRGGVAVVPEFIALTLGLSVYAGAFIAEIFRSSIQAVDGGQGEAAAALGLRRWPALRLVVLPLAIRSSLPPLANQYVNVIKYSSLAAAIGYPDLMQIFGKTTLNQTGQAFEVLGMTLAVYLCASLATAAVMRWYEAHTALVRR